MKIIFTAVLILSTCFIRAQPLKPYLAIVETSGGKIKGILCNADGKGLLLDQRESLIKISADEIRSVKIRKIKNRYRAKHFMSYSSLDESNSEKNVFGERVRKANEKEPTLKEEVNGRVGVLIVNGLVNILVMPFHLINPSVYNAEYKEKGKFSRDVIHVAAYSIFYQVHPAFLNSLAKQ